MLGRLFLVVASLACLAAAQGFNVDPITKGDLAVWCIYSFLYLIETGACAYCVYKLPGHRLPYALLFGSLLFMSIAAIITVASIVITGALNLTVADALRFSKLQAAAAFFTFWTFPQLFIALAFILHDRFLAINTEPGAMMKGAAKLHMFLRYLTFLLMFTLGTASAALEAQANLGSLKALLDNNLEQYQRAQATAIVAARVVYAHNAFFYLSAVEIIVLAFSVHKTMRSKNVSDSITRNMRNVVAPSYIIYALINMIFTIVFSPSGLRLTSIESARDSEIASLCNDILFQMAYFVVTVSVLYLGLGRPRTQWNLSTSDGGIGPVNLNKWHQNPVYSGEPRVDANSL